MQGLHPYLPVTLDEACCKASLFCRRELGGGLPGKSSLSVYMEFGGHQKQASSVSEAWEPGFLNSGSPNPHRGVYTFH